MASIFQGFSFIAMESAWRVGKHAEKTASLLLFIIEPETAHCSSCSLSSLLFLEVLSSVWNSSFYQGLHWCKVCVEQQFSVAKGYTCWHVASMTLKWGSQQNSEGSQRAGCVSSETAVHSTFSLRECARGVEAFALGGMLFPTSVLLTRSFSHCSHAATVSCLFTGSCTEVLVIFFLLSLQNLSDFHNFDWSQILVLSGHHGLRRPLDWEDC